MHILLAQDAIKAADGFRSDPLFYFVVVGLIGIVVALSAVIAFLFKKNGELQGSLTNLTKASTEAIGAMMPILQAIHTDHKDGLRRFESLSEKQAADLKAHINLLRNISP